MASLNGIACKMEGGRKLTVQDEQLLALAHGWAHAATHSIFFYYRHIHLPATIVCGLVIPHGHEHVSGCCTD